MKAILSAITLAALTSGCATINISGELSAADIEAIKALNKAYTTGWMQDGSEAQEAALIPLFSQDATIMPGAGWDPHSSPDALRAFWFPEGAPPTIVSEFSHGSDEIDGFGNHATVRGRYTLKFSYDGKSYSQVGNYMMSMEKQDDGRWLIDNFIWNDKRVED